MSAQPHDNPVQASDNRPPCRSPEGTVLLDSMTEACPVPYCAPDRCAAPAVCALNRVLAGTTVVVKQLTASPDMNRRLREMGFGEEQRVKVISLANNLLCQVCNSRLGLSDRLAETILVQPLSPSGPVRLAA